MLHMVKLKLSVILLLLLIIVKIIGVDLNKTIFNMKYLQILIYSIEYIHIRLMYLCRALMTRKKQKKSGK